MSYIGQIELTKKKPPKVTTDDRAWQDVYDTLNHLIDSVNSKTATEQRRPGDLHNSIGDIKIFKDKTDGRYYMESMTEDGSARREMFISDKDTRSGEGFYSTSSAARGGGSGGSSDTRNTEQILFESVPWTGGIPNNTVLDADGNLVTDTVVGATIGNDNIVQGNLVGSGKTWADGQKPNQTEIDVDGNLVTDNVTGETITNEKIVEADLVGSGKTFSAGQKPNKTLVSGDSLLLDGADQGEFKNTGISVATDGTLNDAGGGKVDGKTAWPSGTRPSDNSNKAELNTVTGLLKIDGSDVANAKLTDTQLTSAQVYSKFSGAGATSFNSSTGEFSSTNTTYSSSDFIPAGTDITAITDGTSQRSYWSAKSGARSVGSVVHSREASGAQLTGVGTGDFNYDTAGQGIAKQHIRLLTGETVIMVSFQGGKNAGGGAAAVEFQLNCGGTTNETAVVTSSVETSRTITVSGLTAGSNIYVQLLGRWNALGTSGEWGIKNVQFYAGVTGTSI